MGIFLPTTMDATIFTQYIYTYIYKCAIQVPRILCFHFEAKVYHQSMKDDRDDNVDDNKK